MSYSAQIYFKKHITTAQDAFLFIDKVKNSFTQIEFIKLKEWFLKDELAIYNFETDRLKERFITENISRTALSFLYFPYYNMVAVIWNYPSSDKLNQLFDGSFYFQNGSDQNYKFDDYKFFPAKLRNDIQITQQHKKEIKEYFTLDDEDWEEDSTYYKLSYRYKLLVQHLGLNKLFRTSDPDEHSYYSVNIDLFDAPNYDPAHRQAVEKFVKRTN